MSLAFWTKHGEEVRKARLLAASAIIYSTGRNFAFNPTEAVDKTFELEQIINEKLSKESK